MSDYVMEAKGSLLPSLLKSLLKSLKPEKHVLYFLFFKQLLITEWFNVCVIWRNVLPGMWISNLQMIEYLSFKVFIPYNQVLRCILRHFLVGVRTVQKDCFCTSNLTVEISTKNILDSKKFTQGRKWKRDHSSI